MSVDLIMTYGYIGALCLLWTFLCVGSFLNVVIHRLPIMLQNNWAQEARAMLSIEPQENTHGTPFNLAIPRSRCPRCERQIRLWENIPVISWCMLRGKCAGCKNSIPRRYPAVELITAIISMMVISNFGFTTLGLFICILTWMLIAATFIDFDHQLLPDQITYPLLWLGLLANGFLSTTVPLIDAVTGAMVGYLFLWGIYWLFKLITHKEGMGYGDFKLLAALGAWTGWQALPSIILIAAALGLFYGLWQILRGQHTPSQAIAFGPFLAIAGWVTLVFRDTVLGFFLL